MVGGERELDVVLSFGVRCEDAGAEPIEERMAEVVVIFMVIVLCCRCFLCPNCSWNTRMATSKKANDSHWWIPLRSLSRCWPSLSGGSDLLVLGPTVMLVPNLNGRPLDWFSLLHQNGLLPKSCVVFSGEWYCTPSHPSGILFLYTCCPTGSWQ